MKSSANFHDISGKSVFISGGGSGIGAALTERFLAQGARVAFVQRSNADDFCKRLRETYGGDVAFFPCDVVNVDELRGAIGQAAEAHGPVDILVNNAAWDNRHTLEETSVEDWDQLINVNLRHYFFAIQAVLPGMRKAGGGTIVNYSSISYLRGTVGLSVYTAAKAGITGMTRTLARELGPDNIRVNAILPGWVQTERQRKLWYTPEKMAAHLTQQCLKQEIIPFDLAEPTLFLASAASGMITGQALVVDGGVVTTG